MLNAVWTSDFKFAYCTRYYTKYINRGFTHNNRKIEIAATKISNIYI